MMEQNNESSAIAEQIMTPYVVMLDTTATFKEVVKKMQKHNISAVIIEDATRSEYFIITKTDIINFLVSGGMAEQNLSQVSVKRIMQGPISLIGVNTPIDKVIRFMIQHNFKRVLIGKDNKPAGIVSTKDIMQWNNTYFKPSKPQILLFMDNINSLFIARHIYKENLTQDVKDELIDAYGGAITSISAIIDEILKKSGTMRQLLKDKRSILFEPYKGITGILISDYNSIELRRKLQIATKKFYEIHAEIIDDTRKEDKGINKTLDLEPIVPIFKEDQS
ncbi:MAG: CBS domain-containing protein [Promethearchaeota archaeon]|jgi:CBS domain-containing protein